MYLFLFHLFRYNAIFSSCYDKNDPCTNSSVKHSAEFMLNLNESFMVGFAGVFKNRTQKQMVREEVTSSLPSTVKDCAENTHRSSTL